MKVFWELSTKWDYFFPRSRHAYLFMRVVKLFILAVDIVAAYEFWLPFVLVVSLGSLCVRVCWQTRW